MEHFNGILFHKSGPANKQYTNQPNLDQSMDVLFNAVFCAWTWGTLIEMNNTGAKFWWMYEFGVHPQSWGICLVINVNCKYGKTIAKRSSRAEDTLIVYLRLIEDLSFLKYKL
jgi:hypothetical protein